MKEPPDGAKVEHHDGLAQAGTALAQALDEFDEAAAQAVLNRLFNTLTVETVLREVLLPYLHELGERWACGAVGVSQEHFATNVIRGRLAIRSLGWGYGPGPRAVLACVPDELHDIALQAFGIVLNRNGWRIGYLGSNTPLDDLIRLAGAIRPELVVLAARRPEGFEAVAADLVRLAAIVPLAVAGPGASPALAEAVGAHLLTGDPVTAAETLPSPDELRSGRR